MPTQHPNPPASANPATNPGAAITSDANADSIANAITSDANANSIANAITSDANAAPIAANTTDADPIANAITSDANAAPVAANTADSDPIANAIAADTADANPIANAGSDTEAAGMIETRVRAALSRLNIAHWEWIAIDPHFGDTADFCREYGFDLPHCANTIIVASKRGPAAYCAGIVRGSDRLDVNRRVRSLMGVSRASFASADETRQLTHMMIGGVTPLALPADLPIYADRRLLEMDYIILGAGSRAAKLKMPPRELAKLPALQFVAGLSLPTA